jgi:hypothetical protein
MKNDDFLKLIDFAVPSTYGESSLLRGSVKQLPNWDEQIKNSKSFQATWERILEKISQNESLKPRELSKSLLFLDLVPEKIVSNLKQIILKDGDYEVLSPVIEKLNRGFINILPIQFLMDEDIVAKFGSEHFIKGLRLLSNEIVTGGWNGLIGGIIERGLEYHNIRENFLSNVGNDIQTESFTELIKGVIEYDKTAKLFLSNAVRFIDYLNRTDTETSFLIAQFDNYLSLYLKNDLSWEGKVISDDYEPVMLLKFYLITLNLESHQLPKTLKKIFDQREKLDDAITLLNRTQERGDFWKEYMPFASRVVPKKGSNTVAVAFYFRDIVIVEFAPSGNAAYVYKKDEFEKHLLNSSSVLGWKNKELAHTIRNFTRSDGTLYHVQNWQRDFSRALDAFIKG